MFSILGLGGVFIMIWVCEEGSISRVERIGEGECGARLGRFYEEAVSGSLEDNEWRVGASRRFMGRDIYRFE